MIEDCACAKKRKNNDLKKEKNKLAKEKANVFCFCKFFLFFSKKICLTE
jgi:hypothetical protein